MKKILLFMLLFVNLQIVIKEHDFMFKAGADVMAQIMSAERYTCYDEVTGDVYPSSLKCEYDKPKYGTKVNVVGGGGSSVEFNQNPTTKEDEQKSGGSSSTAQSTRTSSGSNKDDGQKGFFYDNDTGPTFVCEVTPVQIQLPPLPPLPKYVPVHQIAAIMAALSYGDDNYKKYADYLKDNGWLIADEEAEKMGLKLHGYQKGYECFIL